MQDSEQDEVNEPPKINQQDIGVSRINQKSDKSLIPGKESRFYDPLSRYPLKWEPERQDFRT